MESNGEAAAKPHAVFLPFPAQGHVTPMLRLAKLLHARGASASPSSTRSSTTPGSSGRAGRAPSGAWTGSGSRPSRTACPGPTGTGRRTCPSSARPRAARAAPAQELIARVGAAGTR
uniref:Uncharacterized protein n=1 Tax=Ananas comosus var. bracteatus TaxID=296719 RepID=A0A6V7QVC3_ANACO